MPVPQNGGGALYTKATMIWIFVACAQLFHALMNNLRINHFIKRSKKIDDTVHQDPNLPQICSKYYN